MKGNRPFSRVLTIAFILGGFAATIGCGPHPEEGMLKIPPPKGAVAEPTKPTATKASPKGKTNRKAVEEPSLDK